MSSPKVNALKTAGLTNVNLTDYNNIIAAVDELRQTKEPLPEFVSQFVLAHLLSLKKQIGF